MTSLRNSLAGDDSVDAALTALLDGLWHNLRDFEAGVDSEIIRDSIIAEIHGFQSDVLFRFPECTHPYVLNRPRVSDAACIVLLADNLTLDSDLPESA